MNSILSVPFVWHILRDLVPTQERLIWLCISHYFRDLWLEMTPSITLRIPRHDAKLPTLVNTIMHSVKQWSWIRYFQVILGFSTTHSFRSIKSLTCKLREVQVLTLRPLSSTTPTQVASYNIKLSEVMDHRMLINLTVLIVQGCSIDSSDITHMLPNLHTLELSPSPEEGYTNTPTPLTQVPSTALVPHIIIRDAEKLTRCTFNGDCVPRGLVTLHLQGCDHLESVNNLGQLETLDTLIIQDCSYVQSVQSQTLCKCLRRLNLSGSMELQSVSFVTNCPCLTELCLKDCIELEFLPDMTSCPQLQVLDLTNCSAISNLASALQTFSNCLETLLLSGCHQLKSADRLCSSKNLKVVDLSCNPELQDISGLGSQKMLREVDITDCRKVRGLHCLEYCPFLSMIACRGCWSFTKSDEHFLACTTAKVIV